MTGELLGGDAFLALGAEQHHLVAGDDRRVSAVHEELIHRHGPRHPMAGAADQHVGPSAERPRVPVLVAHRHRRHGRLAPERVAPAVREPLAGGQALPVWLSFDAATATFSGTPPSNFNGTIDLTVTASDGTLSVSDTFTLTVDPVNDAPQGTSGTVTATEDVAYAFTAADFGFADSGDDPANALAAVRIASGELFFRFTWPSPSPSTP